MASTSLGSLTKRLADVDQLMNAHTAIAGPERGRKFEVVGINRAAVLMLSAHLEGFVEDLFAEAFSGVNQSLHGAAVTRNFHNPWPDRIDELFAALGMVKPVRQVSWRNASNKAVRDNLELLVHTRNRVAHGATDVSVHKYEIERYRKYVEGFSGAFDEIVRAHVEQLTGRSPWAA